MRQLWFLVSVACLTACGTETIESSSPKAGDPGTYTRNLEDGTPVNVVIRQDSSLVRIVGDEIGAGTVRTAGSEMCFDFASDDEGEYSWTNGPIRSHGTFESTGPDGTVLVIKYSPDLAPLD